jgi:major vault protein
MAADPQNRDLLLPPDSYLFMQNEGKNGIISVYVGPGVVNQTGQDKPVIFNQETKQYKHVGDLASAVQQFPRAAEGDYVVLENPATDNSFPTNSVQQTTSLTKGRKINIPGPWSNPLWPGQTAKVIKGHTLRSNQFLLVQVYNEEEARKNRAIVKTVVTTPTTPTLGEDGKPVEGATTPATAPAAAAASVQQQNLVVGQRLIIKGTEVAFYIPPTGMEVLPDEAGNFVREAVTLEQLEYSILVDENGKKRIARGPQVVFPEPSERFLTDAKNNNTRKFRAYELNDIQGIHVKVIQTYEENGQTHEEGEELFITGKDQQIYFPRVEHSIISYGEGNNKHYATAVPAGEGRYVMDRNKGSIETVVGPTMLLPDPRTQVTVRRVLTDKQVELWYPGNAEALNYNRNLRAVQQTAPSGRSGLVSDRDYMSNIAMSDATRGLEAASYAMRSLAAAPVEQAGGFTAAQQFVRGTNYTPPRQITLDTKYDGVPAINVWTGYAVMVVSKTGERRVEVGPTTILLNYDETLEVLELSMGKPKTTDNLLKTVYLRVKNNKVSDIITCETSDHVKVTIKVAYIVNFEGDSKKWFDVENYVKQLCDHARSILKGLAKKTRVEQFYSDYLPIIRDGILGGKPDSGTRPGLFFPENGMRVSEVEVLDVSIEDKEVAKLISQAQQAIVSNDIKLGQDRRNLQITKEQEQIAVETAEAQATTVKRKAELEQEKVKLDLTLDLARIESRLAKTAELFKAAQADEQVKDVANKAELARVQAKADLDAAIAEGKVKLKLTELTAETEAAVKRLAAAKDGFAEALVALGREDVLVKVAEAGRIESFMTGQSFESVISRMFAGLPVLQGVLEKFTKPSSNGDGNGSGSANGNRLTGAPALASK